VDTPHEAAAPVRRALAEWQGPALADVRDEAFARAEAGRLDELRQTADGVLGPFGQAVEVLVGESGGTVTVTDQTFTIPGEPSPGPEPGPGPGTVAGLTWLVHRDGTPVRIATGSGSAAPTTAATVEGIPSPAARRTQLSPIQPP
jgi:Bacterial transcriptional activator domain